MNPGPVETEKFHSLSEDEQEKFRTIAPVALLDEITDIITFLASDQSRWINASTVNANNGAILM